LPGGWPVTRSESHLAERRVTLNIVFDGGHYCGGAVYAGRRVRKTYPCLRVSTTTPSREQKGKCEQKTGTNPGRHGGEAVGHARHRCACSVRRCALGLRRGRTNETIPDRSDGCCCATEIPLPATSTATINIVEWFFDIIVRIAAKDSIPNCGKWCRDDGKVPWF